MSTDDATSANGDVHDVSKAVEILQKVLPLCRPARADSALGPSDTLLNVCEILVEAWGDGEQSVKIEGGFQRCSPMQKSRLKSDLQAAGVTLDKVPEDARESLVAAVRKLQDPAGRAELIRMHGACHETVGDDMHYVSDDDAAAHDTVDPACAVSPPRVAQSWKVRLGAAC